MSNDIFLILSGAAAIAGMVKVQVCIDGSEHFVKIQSLIPA